MTWAQRLKRVFDMDVEICDQCGGGIKVIACIEDSMVIKKILTERNQTKAAVYMVNGDQVAEVTIETPDGLVMYEGNASIDGVPGTAAPVLENFPEAAGSNCVRFCQLAMPLTLSMILKLPV